MVILHPYSKMDLLWLHASSVRFIKCVHGNKQSVLSFIKSIFLYLPH